VGGGSSPLTTGTEERGGWAVRMQPEKDLAAAQCATEWEQKFTLLLTFLTLQEMDAGIKLMISYIIGEMRQLREFWGCCKDEITTWESPSIIKLLKFREHAREIAKRAAKASP
jgi:hypothetical protein